jgi:hypothetical protein
MPDLQPRQLVLFDARGRKIRQQTLTGLVTEVQLSSMQKGLYFVLILKDGIKDHAGKLIVN